MHAAEVSSSLLFCLSANLYIFWPLFCILGWWEDDIDEYTVEYEDFLYCVLSSVVSLFIIHFPCQIYASLTNGKNSKNLCI